MDNYYFAYMYTNILKIHMVTVSVINGVSIPILDEKRLGKPPPTKWWSSPSDHAIAPQWGLWGVVCTAMVGWMYIGRYLAVSGVSTVHTS